ncbi:protein delta homolog 1-like [Polyodon spathula]|uniref:protein delta homolog 1-like n=1 Tax=Polyodon spathula TaxID=7913 RepID=UPI001B7DE868|nr:protein delta homolog 1-like [Polyodon spathula]
MSFCGPCSLIAACLLFSLAARITDGAECTPNCNPMNGVCEEAGECRCNPGWQGPRCEQCAPSPGCLHGSCITPWQCICDPGWVGSHCNIGCKWLDTKPCSNNSTCIETGDGGYICICAQGYTGRDCHVKTGPCYTNGSPCQNGGSCIDAHGSAPHSSCLCPSGFTGDFCELDVDGCESEQCMNGGRCVDHSSDHGCACPEGFVGKTCNENVIPCLSRPCENGATCNGRPDGGFQCTCKPGFFGKTCSSHKVKPPSHAQHSSLPSHVFHKMMHHKDREVLKVTVKEALHSSGSLLSKSQLVCFIVLGLLTCLVVLGTTGIVFFSKWETWMANTKYSQLVKKQRNHFLKANNGEEHSVNIIMPEKIKLSNYVKNYTSI